MNMKKHTALCLLLIALAAAMVLSGCGDAETEAGEKETPGATTSGTTDPTGDTNPGDQNDPAAPNNTDPTRPSDPAGPTEPEKKPNTSGQVGTAGKPNTDMTYEQYMKLSGDEQWAHYLTFESGRAFNDWYNAAKTAWDAAQDKEITDGNINLN